MPPSRAAQRPLWSALPGCFPGSGPPLPLPSVTYATVRKVVGLPVLNEGAPPLNRNRWVLSGPNRGLYRERQEHRWAPASAERGRPVLQGQRGQPGHFPFPEQPGQQERAAALPASATAWKCDSTLASPPAATTMDWKPGTLVSALSPPWMKAVQRPNASGVAGRGAQ